MDGFISPAIDQIFNSISDAAFVMYDEVGSGLLPLVAETKIRSALNGAKESFLEAQSRDVVCRSHDEAPPLTFEGLSAVYLQYFPDDDLTETLEDLLAVVEGPLVLDLPAQRGNDPLWSELELLAHPEFAPPLVDLRSWWVQPLVELGQNKLSSDFISDTLLPMLPYTEADGVMVANASALLGQAAYEFEVGSSVIEVDMGSIRVAG